MTFDRKFKKFRKNLKNDFEKFMGKSEKSAKKYGKDARREFLKIKNELDHRFNEAMKRHDISGKFKHALAHLRIASDMEDKGDNIVVSVNLPGVQKRDVVVVLNNAHVDVKAHRKDVVVRTKHGHSKHLSEKYLHKMIPLPAHLKHEKARTEFKHGLLRITIPKKKVKKKLSVR